MKQIAIVVGSCLLTFVGAAQAQECPGALPVPADVHAVACKAGINPERCGAPMSEDDCNWANDEAQRLGLLTADAREWLWNNYRCALVFRGVIASICPEGCFDAHTSVLTIDKEGRLAEKEAQSITEVDRLASLSSEASLDDPAFTPRAIGETVSGREQAGLYNFALDNGRSLRVTAEHPMVLSDGRIMKASEVGTGDTFLDVRGESVEVKQVGRTNTSEKVFNFRVDAGSMLEHVIVAEGVLVGDLGLQNELAREKAAINLRR